MALRTFLPTLITFAVFAAGCARRGGDSMTNEETRHAAHRFYDTVNEAMRTGNMALFDAVVAPQAVDHDPVPGMAPGREGIKRAFAESRAIFLDYRGNVDDVI